MSGEKFSDLIRKFALKQTESFDLDALIEYVEKGGPSLDLDAEDRLFDLAFDSDVLFYDENNRESDIFTPRQVAFKGAEFRVTPLEEEIAGGYLVPGHRFMPFLSMDVFPSEAVLTLPDGSTASTRTVQMPIQDVTRFLLFYGDSGSIDYLMNDSDENKPALLPSFEGLVTMNVFDLKSFFAQCGFAHGDSLMLTVVDWLAGVFSVRHVPAKKGAIDFEETYDWVQSLRDGFDETIEDSELDHDCNEQMARMLWIAECDKETPSVLSNPPLSMAVFFNTQKELTLQTSGRVPFFWPKDMSIESRMMNSLESDGLEPDNELDAAFISLGLSMNSDEAEAYMRDALSRGEQNSDAVLVRVIHGRTLQFPTANEQKEFMRLWRELWDKIRSVYDPETDSQSEVRSVFLGLNDQCVKVLRELDNSSIDPVAVMNNPAMMTFGELGGMIGSALLMCNQEEEDAEAFPLPLDKVAESLSMAIKEISEQLQQEETPASSGVEGDSIYQLKISLKYSKPPIWRRLLVPAGIELDALHGVIQTAFGWMNSHFHQFVDGRTFYQPEAEVGEFPSMKMVDSAGVRLSELLQKKKDKIVYEYDFGDSWEHEVLLEKVLPADPNQPLPFCVKGKLACPPEDCGGIQGYYQMLETLADPDSEEAEELLEWAGGPIDPEAFDLEQANARIRAFFR